MSDSMQPLTSLGIEGLQVELSQNLPSSIQALCFLKSVLNWKEKRSNLKWSVLCPNGEFTDCTFVVFVEIFDLLLGTLYSTTDQGSLRLKNALISSNLVPWDLQFYFTAIPEHLISVMADVLASKNVEFKREANITYWLPPERASLLKEKLTPDVTLTNLKESDAVKMSELWSHKSSKSVSLIEEMIRVNFGMGAYLNGSDELVSWGMHWFYGGLAVVHTSEEHRGKGYATAIVTSIVKRLVSKEWPVFLIVLEENMKGHNFFKNLGFEPAFKSFLHFKISS